MPNGLTWSYFHKQRIAKERKEKLYSAIRFAVIIGIWFSFGVMIGRFVEAVIVGHIF